jgi:hypothetical protein
MAWKADKDRLPILQRRASQLRKKLQDAESKIKDQETVLPANRPMWIAWRANRWATTSLV